MIYDSISQWNRLVLLLYCDTGAWVCWQTAFVQTTLLYHNINVGSHNTLYQQ